MQTPQPVDNGHQVYNNRVFYKAISDMVGDVVDIVTAVGADTEFYVEHGLQRVPMQVDVLTKQGQTDAYIAVKPSGTAWTKTRVYLKCNTATCSLRLRIT